MKVIDLLNKKANGEELPSVINCYNQTFYLSDGIYIAKNQAGKYFEDYFDFSSLDYEVETIEDTPKEDKKIEEFNVIKDNSGDSVALIHDSMKFDITFVQAIIFDKINEIIDKINGDEENEN